jgi:hypothetical protein
MMRVLRYFSLLSPALLLICFLWPDRGIDFEYPLPVREIQPVQGSAYRITLSPITLLLVPGDAIGHLDRARTMLFEDKQALGPAHSGHDDIKTQGQGAFSHWWTTIYFSTSDNSDPRSNGRTYTARLNLRPTIYAELPVCALAFLSLLLNPKLIRDAIRGLGWNSDPPKPSRSVREWFGLVLLATLVVPLFFVLSGEVWIRLRYPEIFSEIKYPRIWDPHVGFRLAPQAEILNTNHLDYWVRETTNSYGYADREWNPVKPPGVCRVAFFGNSFLEAVQVPIAEKVQVRFEEAANRALASRKVETAAFAYTGTGQANQLPYYDFTGRKFHPDVVILMFSNSTDFSSNSAVLKSLENGWNPDHLPQFFLTRKTPAEPFAPAPLDPDWQKYLLSDDLSLGSGKAPPSGPWDWLKSKSYFCAWLAAIAPLRFPALALVQPNQRMGWEIYSQHMAAIRRIPGYEHSFDGWNYPKDWSVDSAFATRHPAPIFREALAATGAALDAFIERGRRDGFRVVIYANPMLSDNIGDPKIEEETGNPGVERGRLVHLKALADQRGIPVIDGRSYLDRHGIDPNTIHWAHEIHWNSRGHEVAAAALLEAFQAHPEWLEPAPSRR